MPGRKVPFQGHLTLEQVETLCRKMGVHIELFPGGGAYVSLPDMDFGDYGQDVSEAKVNLIEKAFQVARMSREPGEKWTLKLDALVARLRELIESECREEIHVDQEHSDLWTGLPSV